MKDTAEQQRIGKEERKKISSGRLTDLRQPEKEISRDRRRGRTQGGCGGMEEEEEYTAEEVSQEIEPERRLDSTS